MPTTTVTNAEEFLGSTVRLVAVFENGAAAAADVGYGPYLDVVLPTTPNPLTFVGATYLGQSVGTQLVTLDATGTATHPFALDAGGGPVVITGPPNGRVAVLTLPFGSVTPGQPGIAVDIDLAISPDATPAAPIAVRVTPGFRYGADPLDNAGADPQVRGAPADATVTPLLARLDKRLVAPEGDTPVGESFTHRYEIVLEVAGGQTLTGVTFTDTLPTALVIRGGTLAVTAGATDVAHTPGFNVVSRGADGGAVPPGFPAADTGPYAASSFTVALSAPLVTPVGPPTRVVVGYDFYIPAVDANGDPAGWPSAGDQVTNRAVFTATWTGNAAVPGGQQLTGSDTAQVDISNDDDHHPGEENGTIRVQKWVGGHGASHRYVAPGELVDYYLDFQVSDVSAFQGVGVSDVLPDGLEFVPGSMRLSYSRRAQQTTTQVVPVVTAGSGGTQVLGIDVSGALQAAVGDGRLLGACVPDGFGGLEPTCSSAPGPSTTGVITYQARVLHVYRAPTATRERVLQNDTLSNVASVTGTILNVTTGAATANTDTDTSAASVGVRNLATSKAITHINGAQLAPGATTPAVVNGDVVTFRLRTELGALAFKDLVVSDYLPLPVFRVPAAMSFTGDCGASVPAVGQVCYAPGSTFGADVAAHTVEPVDYDPLTVPAVTTAANTNSFHVAFGSVAVTTGLTPPSVIELYVSLAVEDTALADGLFITNLLQASDINSVEERSIGQQITQLQYTRPQLNVSNGVIALDATSTGGQGLDLPVSVASPLASGSAAGQREDHRYDLDVAGLDARDVATYLVIVENVGRGRAGAYDVRLRERLPAGLSQADVVPGSLVARLGSGAPVSLPAGAETDLFGPSGMLLAGHVLGRGLMDGGAVNATGNNILYLTYQVRLPATVENAASYTTRSEVASYAAEAGGANLTVPGLIVDDVTVSLVAPTLAKSVIATSEAHTGLASGVQQVAIGEVVRYRLTFSVPEGNATNVVLTDTLPSGLTYLPGAGGVTGVRITAVSQAAGQVALRGGTDWLVPPASATVPTGTLTASNSAELPAGRVTFTGATLTLSLGDVVNGASDREREQLVVEFDALVINTTANNGTAGTNAATRLKSNSFSLTSGPAAPRTTWQSPVVQVRVFEPRLSIVKTVSPTGNIDAGDTLTYAITLTNAATNAVTAFDVTVTDQLPQHVEYVSHSITAQTNVVSPSAAEDSGRLTLTATSIAPGGSVTLSVQARLASSVPSGASIVNTASYAASSLPGANGTGGAAPGAPGANDGERNYTGSSQVTLTARAVAPGKSVVATSEAHTTGTAVTVGEVVRFRLVASVPEGVSAGLRLVDTLPTGLAFVDPGQVRVAFLGTGLSVPADLTGALQTAAACAATPSAPTFTLPSARVATTGAVTTFEFGDVQNLTTDDSSACVVLEFNARVTNVAAAASGAVLTNGAAVAANGRTSPTTAATVTVVEPALGVTKSTSVQDGVADAGDTVDYTIEIAHAAASTSDAFDLTFTDELPAALTGVSVSVSPPGSATYTLVDRTLTVTSDALPLGATITVGVTGRLVDDLGPGTSVVNAVGGTWTGLPGDGTPADENPTGSASSGERPYGPVTDSTTFVTADLGLAKAVQATSETHTSGTDVAIGEVVRYRLTVVLPQGSSSQLTVRDTLPAGLAPAPAAGVRAALVAAADGVSAASLTGIDRYASAAALPAVLAEGDSLLLGAGVATFAGDQLTVALGDVANTATDGAAAREYLVLEYNAVVTGGQANAAGTTLTNAASVALGNDARDTASATVTVREPALDIVKAVVGGDGLWSTDGGAVADLVNVDIGEIVTYRVTLTNAAGAIAAHDVSITDAIPTDLTLAAVRVTRPGQAQETLTPGAAILVEHAVLLPGQALVVEYDVVVQDTAAFGQVVTNTAAFSASSVQDPEDNSDNPTGTDAGTPRTYTGSDTATVKLAEPAVGLAKRLASGPTVADEGDYALTFAFVVRNTGAVALAGVRVSDDLDATFPAAGGVTVTSASVTDVTVGGVSVVGAANQAYDGSTDVDLVTPGVLGLDPGQEALITLAVDVRLADQSALGTYTNTAIATGATPGGIPAAPAQSSDGTDPEGPVAPTPVPFTETPGIAIAKTQLASAFASNEDGTFAVTYRLTLSNTGEVPLRQVQVVDDLGAVFGGPVAAVATDLVSVSPGSTVVLDTAYDGVSVTTLLVATDGLLAVGGSAVIDVSFTVAPANSGVAYVNQAGASGVSPLGQTVTDADTADLTFASDPSLVIGTCAQAMTAVSPRGTFTFELVVRLRNTGDMQLSDTQATLDLSTVFAQAGGYTLDGVSVTAGGVSVNPGYGTLGDWDLLAPGTTLHTAGQAAATPSASDYVELTLRLTVVPGNRLDYTVVADAVGTSPLDAVGAPAQVTDAASGWCDPAGAPGVPPTVVVFSDDPSLGVAKRFASLAAVPGQPGVFDVDFEFVLTNYGDAQLNAVTLADDFAAVFADGSAWRVADVRTTGTLVPAALPLAAGATNLLAPASYLGSQGQNSSSGTVSVTLRVTPVDPGRTYENTAVASGTNPDGDTAADTSVDGADPDPNADGDPTNDASPTPFTFESPRIGVAKSVPTIFDFGAGAVANPVNHGDGTFEVAYLLTVRNYGDVPLSDLVVTDDLLGQLAAGNPTSVRAGDGTLLANAAYDGSVANVLAAGQTLGYSETELVTGTVYVVVTLQPGAALAGGSLELANQATAQGTSPGGQEVTDDSNAGLDPDAGQPDGGDQTNDGDGDPGNNGGATTVTLTEAPRIAIAKALTGVENLGDGSYGVAFTLTVVNVGDVNLAQVQVTDNLNAAFRGVPVTLTALAATAPLAAATDPAAALASGNLLDPATSSLAVGESATLTLAVVVRPGAALYAGAFENLAVAAGTSPAGTRVSDTSNDGATPEPGEESPTEILLTEAPSVGVAKGVPAAFDFGAGPEANPRNLEDGTYEVAYAFTVGNYGDVSLTDLSLTDDLATQLAAGNPVAYRTVSGSLAANPAWDGTAATDLLAPGQGLAARTPAGPTLGDVFAVVTLRPGAALVSGSLVLDNQAEAAGTSPGRLAVTDASNAGTDPDGGQPDGDDPSLDGDGDPTNNAGPTTVSLTEAPRIAVAKRVVTSANNGDGSYAVDYALVVTNVGDVDLRAVQVADAFGTTFRGAQTTVVSLSADAPLTAAAPAQAQATGLLLDATASALAVGGSAEVRVGVVVVPGARIYAGPFLNTATASGASPSSAVVTDESNDGTVPDPDDATPTPITLTEDPVLGVAKAASVTPVGDGRFDVRFTFTVVNLGDVELRGLQLTDDLVAAFGAGAYTVMSLYSPTLNVNTVAPDPANAQAYDGAANQNLLRGTDTLVRGVTALVELRVRVTPDHLGTHENRAVGSGTSPGERPVADDSTNGLEPDPNRDGVPDEDVPTPVVFEEAPAIGLAKSATVTMNDDGTFGVVLTFTVRNMGDVPLRGVQVTDPLTGIYAITDLTPDRVTAESSDLTINPRYDGVTDANVLAGTDSLAVGAERQVTVRLERVRPTTATSTTNTAVASGASPNGTPVEDRSTDGFEPDPNDDGDPSEETPTPIVFDANPRIAIAKRAALTVNGDGSYDVAFTLTVANAGNTSLHGVQVRDDLAEYFAGTDLTPARIGVTSDRFTINPAFDGRTDPRLLSGTDSLSVGARGTITVVLTGITTTGNTTTFANTAIADGRSPTGALTTDRSNDGVEPVPGVDVPTVTELRETPMLGVAKAAGVVQELDGTYTVTFDLVLTNYGNVALQDLSLTDDLSAFYADAGLSALDVSVSSPDLPVNPAFDGNADTELLGAGATLAVGASARVTLVLSGLAVGQRTAFTNQAEAAGRTPRGSQTPPERSTDGTEPDPDGDGDPTNDGVPTPVVLDVDPALGVAKRARTVVNQDGSHRVEFTIRLANLGNAALVNLSLEDDLGEFYAHTDLTPAAIQVSSTDFPVNAGFDGRTDTELLGAGASLAVGASGSITLTLDPVSATDRTDFTNVAVGVGETPGGVPVADDSQNGTDPDPDGDGDPTNNDDPTPVRLESEPRIGVAKRASVTANPDGSFDVRFDVVVGNYGNAPLVDVQLRDDLTAFYDLTDLTPAALVVTSPDFAVNPAFDGRSDPRLLAAGNTLGVGESGTLTLTLVAVRVAGVVDTHNTAVGTGTDPTGKPAPPDLSQDGPDPDPDGDDDPTNDDTPTPVRLGQVPAIGVAKAADATRLDGGGYDIRFTLVIRNYGDVPLADLSVTDPLADFYALTDLTGERVSARSDDLAVNPAYDGLTDAELLAPGNRLGVGETATVVIELGRVMPNAGVTRVDNLAYATGTAPDGTEVSDTSTNGDDPDPDGRGAWRHSEPTPVLFSELASVLMTKTVAPGPYGIGDRVPYTVTILNPNDVAVAFDLLDRLPPGTAYLAGTAAFVDASLTPPEGSEPFQDEPGVIGWRSIVVPAGDRVQVGYALRVLPGAQSPLVNVATATGASGHGAGVSATASAIAELKAGVFDQERGLLIGRVYLDVDGDSDYREGLDAPIANARVVLSNGWQTLTDAQGNYAFRDLAAGTWTVMVDRVSAPYRPSEHPEQLRDERQHIVRVQGLTVSDFPFLAPAGLASSVRETTVRFGPITLTKRLQPLPDGVRVVLEVTSDGVWPPIVITDPVTGADARTFVVTPGEPAVFTYDLPLGAELTDPSIDWSQR